MALTPLQRWLAGPVCGRHLSVCFHQMAVMLNNGISLADVLDSLEKQQDHIVFREVLENLAIRISTGWTLSVAMAEHPGIFRSEALMLVRAGESSGDLAARLRKAADLEERRFRLFASIRQALISPGITLTAGTLVLVGVTNFVMPRFLVLYDQLNVPLPLISKLVIGLVRILNHPLTWVVGILLALAVFRYRDRVREHLFDLILKLPVLRRWVGTILCSQFCDILGSLHREGVPFQRILSGMIATTDLQTYHDHLHEVHCALKEEGSLSHAIRKVPYFPPLVYSVCLVGEESGGLDTMLASVTRMLENQIDMVIAQFTSVIEPLLIVGLGAILGVFFVGMFLPVYGILSNLGV